MGRDASYVNGLPNQWANEVGAILDEFGQPWALAGALAAIEYRERGRATGDADLLTTWNPGLPTRLEAAGYAVAVTIDPDGDYPHLLRLRRDSSAVDLIIADTPYQHEAIARAGAAHLLTIEDVLIHKVLADRARDRGDVASILATDPQLDHEYLDAWLDAWDITDRWHAARDRHQEAHVEHDAGLDFGL